MKSLKTVVYELLSPSEILERVEDIQLEALIAKGYRALFLDIDNTLVSLKERNLSLQKLNWLSKAKALGFEVFFVSNNRSQRRIERFCKQAEVTGVYRAWKPFVYALQELAGEKGIDLEKSVVVGDQLLTDVILGRWVRAHTVLVDPIDKRLSFIKAVQREIEMTLIRNIQRRR
ncbi:MAG: YqeG family HAD IIIA-type phosphatase [Candidatus Margulisiibacteriota bacterium]